MFLGTVALGLLAVGGGVSVARSSLAAEPAGQLPELRVQLCGWRLPVLYLVIYFGTLVRLPWPSCPISSEGAQRLLGLQRSVLGTRGGFRSRSLRMDSSTKAQKTTPLDRWANPDWIPRHCPGTCGFAFIRGCFVCTQTGCCPPSFLACRRQAGWFELGGPSNAFPVLSMAGIFLSAFCRSLPSGQSFAGATCSHFWHRPGGPRSSPDILIPPSGAVDPAPDSTGQPAILCTSRSACRHLRVDLSCILPLSSCTPMAQLRSRRWHFPWLFQAVLSTRSSQCLSGPQRDPLPGTVRKRFWEWLDYLGELCGRR